MDITKIRYFLKTAELLNYSKAAQELFITRQSLRQSIASMEQELGEPLFVNNHNRLILTEYGEYLAFSGLDVLRAFDSMMAGMTRLVQHRMYLRVACSVCLFPFIFPNAEAISNRFQTRYPDISLTVSVLPNDEVIRAVQAEEFDCGCIIQMPKRRSGCTFLSIDTFPAVIDFCQCESLQGKPEIELEDLAELSCVSLGGLEETLYPLWKACRDRGLTLNYREIPNTIDAFYMVQHGQAVGVDLYSNLFISLAPVSIVPLRGFEWEMGVLVRDDCRERKLAELFAASARGSYEEWIEKRRESKQPQAEIGERIEKMGYSGT